MSRLTMRLLGGFEAQAGDGRPLAIPTRKAQALLAYLALTSGQTHPRDKLAALLWSDASPGAARNALRQTLFVLRKALASASDATLIATGDALTLAPDSVNTDVTAFEHAAATGTRAALEGAVALYQGDLLAGLTADASGFEEWLMSERERLRELALEALARLLAQQRAAGAVAAAVQSALRLLALDPLQESVHRSLMRLYAQQGRRHAALRQYQECVEVLRRELDVEPEAETQGLYREILRQRPGRSATMSGVAVLTEMPIVGRKMEIGRLYAALGNAWTGHGGVIAVVGEAGIGKTRLLAELGAEAGRRGGAILLARAYESEQILPFGPWVSALRDAGVVSDTELLEELGGVWRTELARLFPELAASSPASDQGDPLQLFQALVRLLHSLALRQPVVVLLEDAHWADEMTLRCLAFVVRRLHPAPILVAISVREEELSDNPILDGILTALTAEGRLERVPLGPLGREDTLDLVRWLGRAGNSPMTIPERGEQVWSASGGNPLIVVETVRAIRDGVTVEPPSGALIPARVREMLTRRLDRLHPAARDLATVAAVIGREFDFSLLQAAAGVDARTAAERLEELVRRRVVHVVGDRFDFSHDRIREVARRSLLDPRRRVLHGAVAAAIEALHAGNLEPQFGTLAVHYREAESWNNAVEYFRRFAETATRRYAHAEAMTALQEADRYVERLPTGDHERIHLDLVLRQCDVLYFQARFADTVAILQGERDRMERLGAPEPAGRYHFQLARAHSLLGHRELAVESAQFAIVASTRSGDEVTCGKAHYVLSREKFWLGEPREGLAHGLEAVRIMEQQRDPYWLAMACMWTGQSYYLTGDFTAALEAMGRARGLADTIGDSRLQSDLAWRTAQMEATRGEWEAAVDLCERALENPSSHPLNRANALARLGLAHVEAGNPAAAIPPLDQALDLVVPIAPTGQARGWYLTVLAEAHLLAGELLAARERATQALTILETAGYRDGIAHARRTLGRIVERQGDHGEAKRLLTEALSIYESESALFEMGRTRLALAEVAHAESDREAAKSHLEEAHRLFVALGVRRYVERAEGMASAWGQTSA